MNDKKTTRSSLLDALCILTFIGSTASFFIYFLAALFFEQATKFIIKFSNWHSVEAISPIYFTILMALSALSLVGAIRMWKLHRDGFFIYTISQLIFLFLPIIWLDVNAFSVTGAIFTGVFVAGYAMSWRWLR